MQWLFKPIGDVIMIMSIFFIQSMHHIHIEATLQISTTRVEKAYFFLSTLHRVSTLAKKHLIHEKRVANIIATNISCTLPAPSLSLAHINGTQTLLKKWSEKVGCKGKMFATRRTFFQFVFLTKSNSSRNFFYIIKK